MTTVRRIRHMSVLAAGVGAAVLTFMFSGGVSGRVAISSADVSQPNPPQTTVASTGTMHPQKHGMYHPDTHGSYDQPTPK